MKRFEEGDLVYIGSVRGCVVSIAGDHFDEPHYRVHREDFPDFDVFGVYKASQLRRVHPLIQLAECAE